MRARLGAPRPSQGPVLALVLLFVLSLLAGAARACGGDGDGGAHWDREIDVKGRRRSLLSFQGRRCGAVMPSADVLQAVEFRLAAYSAKEAARGSLGGAVYYIPTYVYNVVSSDGSDRGSVPEATLRAQVDALNEAYATAVTPDGAVSNSGDQAGINWRFDLQGITTIKAGDMCEPTNEKAIKMANRKGGKGALNLYITDLSACGLLGYSTWPWELDPKAGKQDAQTMDGVVIHYATLPGGSYKPYDMGRTCIHETGHWMGIYHVFQSGCSKGGDLVDDTPYQAAPTEGCPSFRDTCPQPGEDPFWNFMDYTDDRCMKGFTAGQHKRMEAMWQLHRAG
ncbi:zinc metalloprotease [Raphidocelis subcapitata]|uniref:Zinc metalloprotease n=1 Tax=Raphidocelis subcapitata TaxID=307507 RepID=A0A2V0NX81_9CHLO|nr:zinc metalloprotease [Raphidocelis subcapitata]|eukprot:GBF91949.1 zinc metalloprotease [Raphidocelis subcapitata]